MHGSWSRCFCVRLLSLKEGCKKGLMNYTWSEGADKKSTSQGATFRVFEFHFARISWRLHLQAMQQGRDTSLKTVKSNSIVCCCVSWWPGAASSLCQELRVLPSCPLSHSPEDVVQLSRTGLAWWSVWPSVLSPLWRLALVCPCTCRLKCQASHQTCTTTQTWIFPSLFPKPRLDMVCSSGSLSWAQIYVPCSARRVFWLQTDIVCWVILHPLCLQVSFQHCPPTPGSSQLLPSHCLCRQPRGHMLPQLDLSLMAAHASAGCCLAVRLCAFSKWSLNFCS